MAPTATAKKPIQAGPATAPYLRARVISKGADGPLYLERRANGWLGRLGDAPGAEPVRAAILEAVADLQARIRDGVGKLIDGNIDVDWMEADLDSGEPAARADWARIGTPNAAPPEGPSRIEQLQARLEQVLVGKEPARGGRTARRLALELGRAVEARDAAIRAEREALTDRYAALADGVREGRPGPIARLIAAAARNPAGFAPGLAEHLLELVADSAAHPHWIRICPEHLED